MECDVAIQVNQPTWPDVRPRAARDREPCNIPRRVVITDVSQNQHVINSSTLARLMLATGRGVPLSCRPVVIQRSSLHSFLLLCYSPLCNQRGHYQLNRHHLSPITATTDIALESNLTAKQPSSPRQRCFKLDWTGAYQPFASSSSSPPSPPFPHQ